MKEGVENNDSEDEHDIMYNSKTLGRGALSSLGMLQESVASPLHSSLRSSLPTPASVTEILISTEDVDGNGHAGGGGDGRERR